MKRRSRFDQDRNGTGKPRATADRTEDAKFKPEDRGSHGLELLNRSCARLPCAHLFLLSTPAVLSPKGDICFRRGRSARSQFRSKPAAAGGTSAPPGYTITYSALQPRKDDGHYSTLNILVRGGRSRRLIREADAPDANELGEVGAIVGRVRRGVDVRLGLQRRQR